jgi:hypothetical protein
MADAIDQEIQAIRTLLQALEPLSARARKSALEYVLKRLEIRLDALGDDSSAGGGPSVAPESAREAPISGAAPSPVVHLKVFREQKRPRSDSEMAAIVAYYLAKMAAPGDRKESISKEDIETYFNIAGHPLPKQPQYTLPNAKNAGYFKLLGKGLYALNPVGQNLVAYNLPRDGAKATSERKSRGRKPARTTKGRRA